MPHWKASLARAAVYVGEALRPMLVRVLPMETLKNCKNRLMDRNSRAQRSRVPFEEGAYPSGVNLIGYARAGMGLGQGCRLMAAALEHAPFPYTVLDIRLPSGAVGTENAFAHRFEKAARYSVNLVHINAEQTPYLHITLPAATWDKRYNIAIWLWELEDFPNEWTEHFSAYDEIWTPTRFNSAAVAKKSPVPVVTIPYGVEAPVCAGFDRAHFGLPGDRFLFLCMYDVNSTSRRKNPLGAIRAFQCAFTPEQKDVALAVKVNGGSEQELRELREAIGEYRDSILLVGDGATMPKEEVNALINACDAFVSLHRSEGFGLVIAESMLLGKPCIATNWSGNVDFMDSGCACPVDFELVPVGEDCGPYKAYQRWAEPNLLHAAAYMRRLSTDPAYCAMLSVAAKRRMEMEFSAERCAQRIQARLAEIGVV